ncbi:hypothetical protein G3M48_009324 [Beauveria asiatica]|uniref:Uncharacterized protein n=1 Tax=Beauveria asiatica TaxID=1069075 RepID=A0AAW0RJ57_9HYPO
MHSWLKKISRIILAVCMTCLLLNYRHDLVIWRRAELPSTITNAIVFYVTQDIYACSALVNIYTLQQVVGSQARIIVMVSKDVSTNLIQRLREKQVTLVRKEPPPLHSDSISYYQGCLLKLVVFSLNEIDPSVERALVLDSDQLVLRNLDSVFETSFRDFTAAPAYWINNQTLSSTCMLIEPSLALWGKVRQALETIRPDQYDMDIMNEQFGGQASQLSGSYSTLNSHWEDHNVPKWFEVSESSESVAKFTLHQKLHHLYLQSHIIHFTAVGKPWMYDAEQLQRLRPDAHPLLFTQWVKWRAIAMRECPAGLVDHV